LQALEPKLKLIRDRVRGVAKSFHTGFYLWGDGGTSKSFTVLEELQKLKTDYVVHNSRMTGRGLVDTLQRLPSSVHVVEDCESILGVTGRPLSSKYRKTRGLRHAEANGPSGF
jgi:hypothetical protein